MAFSVEVQSSQSRPQTHNTNQHTNNKSGQNLATVLSSNYQSEPGVGSVQVKRNDPNDNDNHELKKSGKYNIDDPGTAPPPTTGTHTGAYSKGFNEFGNLCSRPKYYIVETIATTANESNCGHSNTETNFETKNIFAYQACKATTGSASYIPDSGSPPERIESGATPPPPRREQTDGSPKNNKNTIFESVSNKDKSGREVPDNSSDTGRKGYTSLPAVIEGSESKFVDSSTRAEIQAQVERFFNTPPGDYSKSQNDKYFVTTLSGFDRSSATAATTVQSGKRQEINTREYSQFGKEQEYKQVIIDLSLDGRHRVDRCRYVPYSSGYEWSNAAYCYS